MAPIKFDENIKNKLEQRTLQPSSDAWNTLSEQLDAHDKKNSRGLFFYIGIAASIVGVLFVTTLFLKASEEQQSVSPTLVDTEQIENIDKAEPVIPVEANSSKVANSSKGIADANQDSKEKTSLIQSSIKNEPKVAIISEEKKIESIDKKRALSSIETKASVALINNTAEKKKVTPLSKLSFEQIKVNQVVAEIKKLESEGTVVTDTEIENLLKAAEKEILRDRIYNETTRTVNADALLQDVEDDLEQSFRTRVFESLKSSYKTVKTAVAERNN